MDNRREFLHRALQLSVLSAVLSPATLALVGQRAQAQMLGQIPANMPPGRSVYELRGDVFVDQQRATDTTLITADSHVRTGSNSYIIFVVGRDAYILRENSELQLRSEGVVATGLRLVTGKLLSVFGQRNDEALSLSTSTATIGIRGTGVYAESYDDRSYLCTCYGRTLVSANAAPSQAEMIEADYHDARYVLANPEQGRYIIPGPYINHTDEELVLLEALVGRVPPFNQMRQDYQGPRRRY
ncbi:hypothetical protein ACFOSD_04255 [Salinispirillum marinum]|uniref:FecR protein domain-containing protein n=2 Tax=Saccharospirillaceae TaxID=255527 RepID=A0ABV8BE92_9GAMM